MRQRYACAGMLLNAREPAFAKTKRLNGEEQRPSSFRHAARRRGITVQTMIRPKTKAIAGHNRMTTGP